MFGLSFLTPLFLVGVAAAALPIALHLFYRRAEPVVEFAAMRYLRQAPVEQARRRRLRELLLLALRVSALVLLAAAFARPYLAGTAAALSVPATLVLVDTSASMTAPGQFERARARAAAAVREAPAGHAVGVLAFAREADVVAPLSQDRSQALAAIAGLQPGAGATSFQGALRTAADAMKGRAGRIVLVTDLQQSGWEAADAPVPDNVEVQVAEVTGPSTNLAVAGLRVENGEAIVALRSYGPAPATAQVSVAADGRRIGVVPVQMSPGGVAEARVSLDRVSGDALVASIADPTGYAADNVRYALFDADRGVSVWGLTASGHPSESLYLARALAVGGDAGGFRFRAISGAGFSSAEADALRRVDVIVVLGTRGLEQRGRERLAEFVRGGGGLLLTAGPDVEPNVLQQALGGVSPTAWRARDRTALSFAPDDARHPVFRPFGGVGSLGNVRFARAAILDAPPAARVIARYTDGSPALVEEQSDGAGRVLVFASDLNYAWNDFPLQPGFLPFVHETVRYLAAGRSGRSDYVVGELAGESGRTPGIARLGSGSSNGTGRTVAVNVDLREADPQAMSADDFQAGLSRLRANAEAEAREEAREREDDQSLWRYGLLLMVISLAVEGLLGRRLG